jgi:hypothetical protein
MRANGRGMNGTRTPTYDNQTRAMPPLPRQRVGNHSTHDHDPLRTSRAAADKSRAALCSVCHEVEI